MWNSTEVGKFMTAVNKGGKVAKKAIANRKAKITPKPPKEGDAPKMSAAQKKKLESEMVLTFEQFIEVITRLAIHLYNYSSGGKPKGGKPDVEYIRDLTWQSGLDTEHIFAKVFKPLTVAAAFQRFIDEYMWPVSHDAPDIIAKEAMHDGEDLMEDVPEVKEIFTRQKKYLKHLFRYYSDSDVGMQNLLAKQKAALMKEGSKDQAADTMSIVEFLWMGQELDFNKVYQNYLQLPAPVTLYALTRYPIVFHSSSTSRTRQ